MNPTCRTIIFAVLISVLSFVAMAHPADPSTLWAGFEHTPLGNATLSISPDDHLIVSNIGSSGLDGVSADFGEEGSSCVFWDFAGGQIPAPGASFRYDALGNLDGVSGQVYGSLLFEYTGGMIQLTADSTPVGSTTHRVQVFDGPILLADLSGQTGVLLAMADSSKVSALDVAILSKKAESSGVAAGKLSIDCEMTLGDGTTVTGNEFRILPEAQLSAPTAINGFNLTAQGTPPIVITAELTGVVVPPTSVYWNGLEYTSRGSAMLAITPDDHLFVSNIGSSGLDGVSVDLPAGTVRECVFAELNSGGAGEVTFENRGSIDGVVGLIGTATYTEMPDGALQLTADFSPIGSSTQLVQIWNGPTLVAEFPGQTGSLALLYVPGNNRYESYVRQDPIDPALKNVGLEAKILSVGPIQAGPLGEDFLGDRVTVIAEGASSTVDDLQGVAVLCSGLESLVISNVILFVSSVPSDDNALPKAVFLRQNTPNPFNPGTSIPFDMPQRGHAKLSVYDVRGSLVRTLESGVVESGRHQRVWLGEDDRGQQVASGVYFYRLETDMGVQTKRMTLVK